MCFTLYLLPYTSSTDWFFITEVESVYWAVRTESLYKTDYISSLDGKTQIVLSMQQQGSLGILKIMALYIKRFSDTF